ncbi:MAG: MFS transporter [Bacteroidales bacterium]
MFKSNFSKAFWVANTAELLERMAYYAVFIVLTLYLSRVFGFSDIEAGIISGLFSGTLYFLPTFSGAYADKIGFRKSMLLAFALLTFGYAGLGLLPELCESLGLVDYGMETTFTGLDGHLLRWAIVPVLALIVVGGSFIKSVITGTVAKETTAATRAKGFSLFYMMVNIGSFTGKLFPDPLRHAMGDRGLIVLQYLSAAMSALALVAVFFFYKTEQHQGEGKSFKEIGTAILKVLSNGKLVALTLIVSGFWIVQGQMYATMPKYVIRMIGSEATPGWYANINPFVVVIMVNIVTHLMRRKGAVVSMMIGMFLIPLSAVTMASGNIIGSDTVLGMHPVAFMMIVGIAIQALAETFISPRFLEYFSLYAPKGDEGLYLGFSHMHSFISYIVGFFISGVLLNAYCPDPKLFETHEAWQVASANAHYIWYYFAAIGLVAAISLIVFAWVSRTEKK